MVTIIILNYKSYDKTRICLNSILRTNYKNLNIIIVDNDSDSEEFIKVENEFKGFSNFNFISTSKNLGYAKGNNFGVDWAEKKGILKDYVAVINNDIEVLNYNIFEDLCSHFGKIDDAGVISPKIIHKESGIIQGPYKKESAFKLVFEAFFPFIIPFRIKKEQRWRTSITVPTKVYRTMGSFLFMKSDLFKKVGMFDKNTFLGSEEEILSEKIKLYNKFFYYIPEVSVLHDHGASTSQVRRFKINKLFLESKLYYFKKYRKVNKVELFLIKLSLKMTDLWRTLLK